MKDSLSRAISIASYYHQHQYDKGGEPYILHCIEVMNKVRQKTDCIETAAAAVLHDILEDTVYSRTQMKEDFGWHITQMVMRLTKREGESYKDYIGRVMLSKETTLIKMCDIEHNSDITRLKGVHPRDFDRIVKYQRTYAQLKEHLETFK